MVAIIMDNGQIIKHKEMVNMYIKTALCMKVNGRMIFNMDRGKKNLVINRIMKALM